MPKNFYSDNDTGTPADALKAVGLAEVLRAWLEKLERDNLNVTIKDHGGYYEIVLPSTLEMGDIARVTGPFAAGLGKKLIKKPTEKEKARAGGAIRPLDGFPYEEKREEASTYFAQRKKLSAAERQRLRTNPEEFPDIGPAPDPDLGLYVCLNHFKVADAYNLLCQQWEVQNAASFQANLALVLEAFAQHPNATEAAAERWEALVKEGRLSGKGDVTLLQVINPASGKGGNAPKANGLGIGNLDGFWLTEYLKFVGFFTIAAPLLIQKSKDRKTYVLHPLTVELSDLRTVMRRFRETFYRNTAVKLDILAALQFTQRLVEYIQRVIQANEGTNPVLALFNRKPRVTDIGRGFEVAFYKDMGSAYATMNLATINLPGWLNPIATVDDATRTLEALEEHVRVVRSIRSAKEEEGSEELELLRRYRDFLSGHDSEVFFDFAARYGDYYLGKRYRNQWAAQFTTEGMKYLMAHTQRSPNLQAILEDRGFQQIAAAIRQATVIAQCRAAQGSYPYEVRYGLGQELLRSAAYPETFMSTLSTFLQAYNAETARIDERMNKARANNTSLPINPQHQRRPVGEASIQNIARLIDANPPELVCKMLVAYGYAYDARIQGKKETDEPGDEVEQSDGTDGEEG